MISSILGRLTFDTGWKTKLNITLFENSFSIVIKARAYYENDGITEKQSKAFADFAEKKDQFFSVAESMLLSLYGDSTANRFIPRTVLFERDGSFAILLDDKENPDDGIAVLLSPDKKVMSQDEYL